MDKIPLKQPRGLKASYSDQASWNVGHLRCTQNREPIDISAFTLAPNKVEFCRHFKSSGIADNSKHSLTSKKSVATTTTSTNSRAIKEIDEKCKIVLREYNRPETPYQEKLIELGNIGLFLGSVKRNSFSRMWKSAINGWKTARTKGFGIFKSAATAITAFYKARKSTGIKYPTPIYRNSTNELNYSQKHIYSSSKQLSAPIMFFLIRASISILSPSSKLMIIWN